jgi:polyhydroxyalkanoate synthesis regulator protein
LEHLINTFKSSQSQLTEEFNKVFKNLNTLEDTAKEELEFTRRQADNINQTEDEFGDFALITPYKKRRINLEI